MTKVWTKNLPNIQLEYRFKVLLKRIINKRKKVEKNQLSLFYVMQIDTASILTL